MQLPNIPTLGGLSPDAPSRREQLARDGERARGEIAALLSRARSRSVELLALLHVRAAAAAKKIDPLRALPLGSLRWPLAGLGGAAALWVLLSLLAPRHVSQGILRVWSGDSGAPPVEPSPIAGDLSITYLYPAYTALPPRTDDGTAGDLRAPRGTEVRISARADRDLVQAFAVVNGAAVNLNAGGPRHRQLSGSFTLAQPRQWSLRFADARGPI